MALSVLFTQCLQNDFVAPVGRNEPLPNELHVGRDESLRLLGADPHSGAVAQLMTWAAAQAADRLCVVHIRDWHDPQDPRQRAHLAMFGPHCVRETPGAAFVLGLDQGVVAPEVVDSVDLNDFEGTRLSDLMAALRKRAGGEPLRVGVVGVWTEAKITYLLYDLKTRCGISDLATCSGLTASSSRRRHFEALDQLRRILGVQVHDTVGEFTGWLLPDGVAPASPVPLSGLRGPVVHGASLTRADLAIVGTLYRDAAEVHLSPLSGGFSGAGVYQARSVDVQGHVQAPSVLKVGDRTLIGKERVAFEQVEEILGNFAPGVRGFVDLGDRAGIKYSYASMGQGGVTTFKSLYEGGAVQAHVDAVLSTVFDEILEPFHSAAQYERLPLLEAYGFSSRFAPSVRSHVEDIVGRSAASLDTLTFPGGYELPNVCGFYESFLQGRASAVGESHYVSYVHGDLNGANILIDARQNVWIIDFAHTARAHVLRDLAKLENDVLYIYTKLETEADLADALRLTEALRQVGDLREPLPEAPPWLASVGSAHVRRAWATVCTLRTIAGRLCREDRDPLQMSVALLRYAAHTMSFDESSPLQRLWALAASCGHAADIERTLRANDRLRVDWVDPALLGAGGRLGMTICPGRRDRGRVLDEDLDVLARSGVTDLVCLLTDGELDWAGVAGLRARVEERGMRFVRCAIPDQGVPSVTEARELTDTILKAVDAGRTVVAHCMGGLGRTGTVAACALASRGMPAPEAIAAVRKARSPRALETPEQERFVAQFAATL